MWSVVSVWGFCRKYLAGRQVACLADVIDIAPPVFDSGRRPWELGLPAICRAPAVKSCGSVGHVHAVDRVRWRFASDRRQGGAPPRQTPTPSGQNQKHTVAFIHVTACSSSL